MSKDLSTVKNQKKSFDEKEKTRDKKIALEKTKELIKEGIQKTL